jgi:drug/metabolite transporter (DMT)-like permease
MKAIHKVPLGVCIGLAFAIILDTAVQLCWKVAVSRVPDTDGVLEMVASLVRQPLFWGVIVMFLTQLANWIKVLGRADLSYAQPITSLSYISVCILSAFFLHEVVSWQQYAGIILILAGVWFISRGEHQTVGGTVE